jgi:PadR family transcriptional regulator PadR
VSEATDDSKTNGCAVHGKVAILQYGVLASVEDKGVRVVDPTQVLKGVLDTAVLGALRDQPSYGYDLVRHLRDQGFSEIADASVYGTLRRLYRAGYLTSEIVESESGPPRKYYTLNRAGEAELTHSKKIWNRIIETMDRILNQESSDEQDR